MEAVECRRSRTQLDAYRDGELPETDRAALEAHLAACSACTAQLRDRQALGGLLRLRAEAVGEELPAGFSARVMAALPPARKRFQLGMPGKILLGFLAAGAVAAAVLLPLLGQSVHVVRAGATENEAHIHRISVASPGAAPIVFQNDVGQTVVWVVPDSDEKPAPGQ
ncbi:MAG TPA: zf-HC2 domain-containing protein [Myxococcales bacterium]|nr:zf-HC2 domain-containing protein [Myxococcales bacterium]